MGGKCLEFLWLQDWWHVMAHTHCEACLAHTCSCQHKQPAASAHPISTLLHQSRIAEQTRHGTARLMTSSVTASGLRRLGRW
jgi:DTW domain-containing protein YfiP